MKLTQIIAASVVAMLALSPVMAQNGNGNGQGNGHGKQHTKMVDELGLNQDQMNQLAVLRAKHLAEVLPLQQQVNSVRSKIDELLKADAPDRGAISKESTKIADLHKQLQEKRVDHLLEIKKIMNKDQWVKFLDKEKRGNGKMGNHQGMKKRSGMH